MARGGGGDGERGRLLKTPAAAPPGAAGETLCWASTAVRDVAGAKCGRREYPALVPWDAWLLLCALCALLTAWLHFRLTAPAESSPEKLLRESLWACAFCCLPAVLLSPRRLVHEADSFVVEFPLHRCTVPAREVLELMMIGHAEHFVDLLRRWSIFPFGLTFRLFCGMPSFQGSACALLTTGRVWSCLVQLEDPIAFLVDIQKPLDLTARYRNVGQVLVREGESLKSKRIGTIVAGRRLRIEKQSGRRVFVHFEDSKVSGWISHINQLGYFLLTKEQDVAVPAAGTVGASELAVNYGTAIELPCLQSGEVE